MSDLPKEVQYYLKLTGEYHTISKQQIERRKQIKACRNGIGAWLQQVPDYEFNVNESQEFGPAGKLCFKVYKRQEYLSKSVVQEYLTSFLQTISPTETLEDSQSLSSAAVDHIWNSRKTISQTILPKRTFKRRKISK